MLYLIDGHNLIPFVAGLNLNQMDDEIRLLDVLQVFCRENRARMEVFFDGASPGWAGTKSFGTITAHFVLKGKTADDAIRRRLDQLPSGSGVVVVSSDRQVQAEARNHRAEVIPSGVFAKRLNLPKPQEPKHGKKAKTELSNEEIEEWLRLFGDDDNKNNIS
ncbi:MAG TPA: NYN domain-containing protein [Leptolinea sp.]